MTKISGLAAITALLGVLLLVTPAAACFDPQDEYATEVLLNKSGLSYDLSKIDGKVDTIRENDAIIYRCHTDQQVAVALFELDEVGMKGLSVKVAMPIIEGKVSYTMERKTMNLDYQVEIPTTIFDEMEARGYENTGEGWEGETLVAAEFSKDDQHISIYEGMKGNGGTTFETFAKDLDDGTDKDAKYVLGRIGVDAKEWDKIPIQRESGDYEGYIPKYDTDPETFDWSGALVKELRWLRDNGVISGLADGDINDIGDVAEQGTAGYNGRVIYHNDTWIPYYDTGDALLKGSFEGCSGPGISKLPGENGVEPQVAGPLPFGGPALVILAVIGGAALAIVRKRKM
jgi:hypothetical protein